MLKLGLLLCLSLFNHVFAAGGYEKPSLWSPRAVGVGGAYSSTVSGADAIQYNPAALNQNEVGVNLAAFGGYLKAPIDNSNQKTTDDLVYSGGLVSSYKFSDKIGFGFGAYGLAGLDTKYKKINYDAAGPGFANYNKDYYGNLQAVEYSLGMSYKITPKLSIGASLRAQNFKANFGQTSVYRDNTGTAVYAVTGEFKDLKGSAAGSYRTGIQYQDNRWGLGLMYRSSVTAKVKGQSSGDRIDSAGTQTQLSGGKTTISAIIPQQLNADFHFDMVKDKVRVLTGYSWTQYSKNKQLKLNGNLGGMPLSNMNQNWKDMNDYKLGLSFLGQTTVSIGYTYTTPVTNKNYASANAAPPGPYHHYGASISRALNSKVSLDGALEYYESKGTGNSELVAGQPGSATGGQKGNYSSGVAAAYLGMRYTF